MDDPTEEPLYQMILRMVLWGELRDDVFHRLGVNGITGERAERIYAAAWSERLITIRRDCARKAGFGLLMVIGAVGIFSFFWFGVRVIPRLVLFICAAMLGIGAWKAIDGLAGMIMAGNKEGPVGEYV